MPKKKKVKRLKATPARVYRMYMGGESASHIAMELFDCGGETTAPCYGACDCVATIEGLVREGFRARKERRKEIGRSGRKGAGDTWRVLCHSRAGKSFDAGMMTNGWLHGVPDGTTFDEIVVGDWLHIEQMDDNDWWGRVGQLDLWIKIRRGKATVYVRDFDETVKNNSGGDLLRRQ